MEILQTNVQMKTPFKRFLASGMFGQAGVLIAQIVSTSLLLPFKMMEIDMQNYTAVFGYTTGLAALLALISGPIWGSISDRTVLSFGRRRIWILLGGIGGTFPLVWIGLATSVTQVMVLWCISSVFFSANWAMMNALVADQVDEDKRGTYGGITGLIGPLGTVLGMGLISLLSSKSISFKFNLLAVIGIIFIIIELILVKERKMEYRKPLKENRSLGEVISKLYPSPRKYPAFSWGILTRLLVCTLGSLGTYNTIMLLQRYGLNQEQVTIKMSLIGMTSILFLAVSSIFGGILSDKFRKQKLFIIGSSIVFIIALLIEAFAPNFSVFFIGACMGSFAYGVFICVDMALMVRILPNKETVGKDMAIIGLPSGLATPIVSFISPFILSLTSWTGYFVVFAVVAALSIFTIMPIPEMSPKTEDELKDAI
jgi:MFS family permease